jgi:hypothetical protein
MDIITNASTAALRSRSATPFVVPSGAQAYWHLGDRSNVFLGAPTDDMRLGIRTTATAPNNPMAVRNPRTTAKQARPPRGVPR